MAATTTRRRSTLYAQRFDEEYGDVRIKGWYVDWGQNLSPWGAGRTRVYFKFRPLLTLQQWQQLRRRGV